MVLYWPSVWLFGDFVDVQWGCGVARAQELRKKSIN